MRDSETAKIGIEASLTGHLVFSTLHTNSAPETVIRLLDLGVDPLNFADALLGVLAQRLLRTLCEHCKRPYFATAEDKQKLIHLFGADFIAEMDLKQQKQILIQHHGAEMFNRLDLSPTELILFQAQGCEKCEHTGYKGRIGIHELLVATPQIKTLIAKGHNVKEIRQIAEHEGMRSLIQDGIIKILNGYSDIQQLQRVVMN
jgi:type II secretory ATPase GspE/PulE/Tfp pilus assembly ATPase PilB-like protein